jgi:uncharacterized protein (DUF427 family)
VTDAHHIAISPADTHVEVAVDGVTIAASDRALVLQEGTLPPRYYLPRDDVRMDLLTATDSHTTCPFKGQASYWSAEVDGHVLTDLVWSYEQPIPEAAAIAGYLAFYNDRVDLTVG